MIMIVISNLSFEVLILKIKNRCNLSLFIILNIKKNNLNIYKNMYLLLIILIIILIIKNYEKT